MAVINTWQDLSCPADCSNDLTLVAIPADQDCVLQPYLSQVSKIYIQPDGATAPFDYHTPTATTGVSAAPAAIDNTAGDNSATIFIVGQGGVADPEEEVYEGPLRSEIITGRNYEINFEVNVKDNSVRQLVKQFQCNWTSFTFWFETLGGQLFGGQAGIKPSATNGRLPLDAARDGREVGTIIFKWSSDNGDAPRHDSPLA